MLQSIDEVVSLARVAAPGKPRSIVGIAGTPGAGKSTLAAEVVTTLGPTAVLLPMDGFHLPQSSLVALGRRERMGAPDTFDVPALLRILSDLSRFSDQTLRAPGFDRDTEEPVPDAIVLGPEHRTVIVEGNYLLLDSDGWGDVAGFLDLRLYLHLDRETRQQRLIARHERFGKSPAEARAWALGTDETNARLIEATATRADYGIDLEHG